MPMAIQFHRHPDGVGCTVGLGGVTVGAVADDAADALHKASDLAAKLDSLIKSHPGIASAISAVPGAGTALAAISAASKAIKYGHDIEHVVSNYGPKVAHVVSKILDFF
jgi:hypothetical protein